MSFNESCNESWWIRMQQTITFHNLFFFHTNAGSPRLAEGGSSVELSVGSNRYLNGHVLVLSFPQPNASLTLQNGALNTLITLRNQGRQLIYYHADQIKCSAECFWEICFGCYKPIWRYKDWHQHNSKKYVVIEFLNMNIMVVTLYINIKNWTLNTFKTTNVNQ